MGLGLGLGSGLGLGLGLEVGPHLEGPGLVRRTCVCHGAELRYVAPG